jgi:putative hydrolase of the HAD superfamily
MRESTTRWPLRSATRWCREFNLTDFEIRQANILSPILERAPTVFLDLDGTCYRSHVGIEVQIIPSMATVAAERLNTSKEEAVQVLRGYRATFGASVIGLEKYHDIEPTGFLDEVFGRIKLNGLCADPDGRRALRLLRKSSEIHILSNSARTHVQRVIRTLGISDYITDVHTVEKWGFIRKPSPTAFTTTMDTVAASPADVLVIDDSYLNLRTANELGCRTMLVSNGTVPPPRFWEMHKREAHEIPDYVDVATFDLWRTLLRAFDDMGADNHAD